MICIILGHMNNSFLNHIVYTFHIPVFFLISGYFFNPSEPLKQLITKRFKGMIVPYFFSCGCILLLYRVIRINILHIDPEGVNDRLRRLFIATFWAAGDDYSLPFDVPGIGAVWFLWATFWALIMLHSLLKLAPVKRAFIIIGLFIFASWTRKNIGYIPLDIQQGCIATFFIYIGYLWKENEKLLHDISWSTKAFACTLASLIWIEFSSQFETYWLVHCDYGHGFVDVVSSLYASFLIIGISHVLNEKLGKFLAPIKMLGRYSIIALCAHIIELRTFPYWIISSTILGDNDSQLKTLYLEIAIKILWMLFATFILSRLTFTRKIFNLKDLSYGKQ